MGLRHTYNLRITLKMIWYFSRYHYREADDLVGPFLMVKSSGGWLKRAREASFLSAQGVSSRLGIKRTAYAKFESDESKMNIATLKRCAEAMDCELVYAIRPKSQKRFSDSIWDALSPGCVTIYQLNRRMYDPAFRKKMNWGRTLIGSDMELNRLLKAHRSIKYHANAIQHHDHRPSAV